MVTPSQSLLGAGAKKAHVHNMQLCLLMWLTIHVLVQE